MNVYRSGFRSGENYVNVGAEERRDGIESRVDNTFLSCCEEERGCLSRNRVSLKCGTPLTTSIPTATETGTAFNVANLDIDTGKFDDACIRFEFVSNILAASGSVTLNFQIVKQCKCQLSAFPVGPVWTFSRTAGTATENNVFAFSLCDCDNCEKGCCNYSVVATVETLDTETAVIISNASLSALIVEDPCC